MKFTIDTKLNQTSLKPIDILLLPVWMSEVKPPRFGEMFARLNKLDQQFLRNFIKQKQPKAGEARLLSLNKTPRFVFIVFEQEFTKARITLLIRKLIRTAKSEGLKHVGVYADDFGKNNLSAEQCAELIAENALAAHYDFAEIFKTAPKEGWKQITGVTLFTYHQTSLVTEAIKRGELIGQAVNYCRTLSNMPPSDLKPQGMAEAAQTIAAKIPGLKVTIFDEKRLKSEGMNAILSVGQGSSSPSRLIIMEYAGGKKGDKSLALVGKGVTFDSGGLNIKPGEHMADMHMDMSGGAAVIYAVYAIAKMKLPVNVIGLIPAVENMPSGLSYRQGDIIKAYGGKTIEIGNTDAEGRVILADAIEYAKTKKPALIVTIATLTGAAVSALGMRMSALFVKNNKPLEDLLRAVGDQSSDLVWPLPLWDEHEKDVEGNLADVINTSKTGTRYGWALLGAAFLSHFAKGVPFVHLDMAPRMTTLPDEELSRGAAGFGVRYFVELAQKWPEVKKLLQ